MPAPDAFDDDLADAAQPIEDAEVPRVALRVRRRLPGRRLDKYLHGRFPRMSRTAIQRLIREGSITVNSRPTKSSYEMADGDLIELTIPPPEPKEIIPEHIPLDVIYEDDEILAINKPFNIICHPAHGAQTGTIANALAYYASSLSRGTAPFRPGIVHRLDKNTTGVMLVAKTDEAHWRLALQFERRTVQKTYLAIVEREMELDADVIDAPIGVHPVVREKFAVQIVQNSIDVTKEAVTRYEVVERFPGFTLVKLSPKTGRTHQLRVHMSYIRHPIFGDTMYGGRAYSELELTGGGSPKPLLTHQALHAWRIAFRHPIRQEPMTLEAPIHPTFLRVVHVLRNRREQKSTLP